jgi:hypothetical protein
MTHPHRQDGSGRTLRWLHSRSDLDNSCTTVLNFPFFGRRAQRAPLAKRRNVHGHDLLTILHRKSDVVRI